MRKLAILAAVTLLSLMGSSSLFAQQDAQYSMYMFNGLAINPAYAGSRNALAITALYRHQWTGFEGAPSTGVLNAHAPLMQGTMGIGGSIAYDRLGVTDIITATVNYAYIIRFNDKFNGRLALGINATINNFRARWTELSVQDGADPSFQANSPSVTNPNFGFGAYYYTDRWYLGASIPTLLNTSFNEGLQLDGTNTEVARKYRHLFFTGGVVIGKEDATVKFKPSFLFKYVKNAPFIADINASILIKDALWLGVSYRTEKAIIGMIEFDLNDRFRIGYAYDYSLHEIMDYSSGTHEVMLGVEVGRQATYLSPRRMSYF